MRLLRRRELEQPEKDLRLWRMRSAIWQQRAGKLQKIHLIYNRRFSEISIIGKKIADDTAQALSEVVSDVRSVNLSISEISDMASRQAQSATQVSLGIDQISAVVQTNSATAEESAAASGELSSQDRSLRELVGRFTLDSKGRS